MQRFASELDCSHMKNYDYLGCPNLGADREDFGDWAACNGYGDMAAEQVRAI